jgi:outer membrane protease
VKKKFVLCLSLIFLFINAYTLDRSIFSLKADISSGLLNGLIQEYVFDEACLNTDNLESRLDWQLKNIPYFELNLDIDFFKYYKLRLNGQIAVPKSSGVMEDYDWLNSTGGLEGKHPEFLNDDPTEVTNYSCSTNNLTKYYTFSAALGGNIYLPHRMKLSPYTAFDYEYIFFDANGGYYIYKDYDNETRYFNQEKIISYTQEFYSFMLGLTYESVIKDRFTISADLKVSPKLTFCNNLDFHYGTGFVYWDNIKYMFLFKAKIDGFYNFNSHNSLGLSFFCSYLPLAKGTDYSNSISAFPGGTWTNAGAESGASYFKYRFSLNYRFTL